MMMILRKENLRPTSEEIIREGEHLFQNKQNNMKKKSLAMTVMKNLKVYVSWCFKILSLQKVKNQKF